MPYLRSDSACGYQASIVDNAFEKLVQDLSAALGPSSGLDSEDVDPLDIQRLMEEYVSDETEWNVYAMADPSRNYTRNLVDEGNGKSNLVSLFGFGYMNSADKFMQLILVWSPGRESAIHDHANAHCVMKVYSSTHHTSDTENRTLTQST